MPASRSIDVGTASSPCTSAATAFTTARPALQLPLLKANWSPNNTTDPHGPVDQGFLALDAFDADTEVDPGTLRSRGLVAKHGLVTVPGRGQLPTALTVRAHAFSAAAIRAIEGAGGRTERLPLPFRRRPPAKGNALTNR